MNDTPSPLPPPIARFATEADIAGTSSNSRTKMYYITTFAIITLIAIGLYVVFSRQDNRTMVASSQQQTDSSSVRNDELSGERNMDERKRQSDIFRRAAENDVAIEAEAALKRAHRHNILHDVIFNTLSDQFIQIDSYYEPDKGVYTWELKSKSKRPSSSDSFKRTNWEADIAVCIGHHVANELHARNMKLGTLIIYQNNKPVANLSTKIATGAFSVTIDGYKEIEVKCELTPQQLRSLDNAKYIRYKTELDSEIEKIRNAN